MHMQTVLTAIFLVYLVFSVLFFFQNTTCEMNGSNFFVCWMLFLSLNQKCQTSKGTH